MRRLKLNLLLIILLHIWRAAGYTPTGHFRHARQFFSYSTNQMDLMTTENLVLVDQDDNYLGLDSKKSAHVFDGRFPRGKLHRAFSVFLFNTKGELLLQQRAPDKITFPGVWSNTCCSHPIAGYIPNEIDSIDDICRGKVSGIKNAAVRKLRHELGIDSPKLIVDNIKYLTRLHYWAADQNTYGDKAPWGEHEIDYVLFARADVPHTINTEEVSDARYVDMKTLSEMLRPESGLLFSPWFRIIANKFLSKWWEDLDSTMSTDFFVEYDRIYRFDPGREFFGGAGAAGAWLGSLDNFEYKKRR